MEPKRRAGSTRGDNLWNTATIPIRKAADNGRNRRPISCFVLVIECDSPEHDLLVWELGTAEEARAALACFDEPARDPAIEQFCECLAEYGGRARLYGRDWQFDAAQESAL